MKLLKAENNIQNYYINEKQSQPIEHGFTLTTGCTSSTLQFIFATLHSFYFESEGNRFKSDPSNCVATFGKLFAPITREESKTKPPYSSYPLTTNIYSLYNCICRWKCMHRIRYFQTTFPSPQMYQNYNCSITLCTILQQCNKPRHQFHHRSPASLHNLDFVFLLCHCKDKYKINFWIIILQKLNI